MPWSDWIQSEPYERVTPARYAALTQSGNGVAGGSLDEVMADSASVLYSTTEAITTVYGQSVLSSANGASRAEDANDIGTPGAWHGGVIQTQSVSWFDTGNLDLATWREWFPDELFDLTEGVDYVVRPDRTGTEDDAFIQYEDGVGELEGWSGHSFGQVTSNAGTYEPRHATAKWRLLSPSPTVPAIPPVDGSVDAPPLVLTPSAGAPIAQILNATTVGGFTPGVSVDLTITGAVTEFAVLMVTDESSDIPFTDGDSYTHEWNVTGLMLSARALVRLPRWRYWVPGDSWVKLKNRGDGLGMSTKRLRGRGTSNQAGRLRGSY